MVSSGLDVPETLEILRSGDFSPLVGEFETGTIECKSRPYRLDTEKHKAELAKDVSAFANATGGILLIGFKTTRDPTHEQDRISEVRQFELALLDTDRLTKLVEAWVWPAPEGMEVSLFPGKSDPSRGVGAIVVQRAREESWPLLVSKTVLDGSRTAGNLIGYFERKLAHVVHHDLARLHRLIQDGRRLDDEIRAGFESIRALIQNTPPRAPSLDPPNQLENRLRDAVQAAGLADGPSFALLAYPRRTTNLASLFESRDAPLVQLLENPPQLRQSGFDLNSGLNSQIVEGRLRRSLVDNYKLLEFHRDGVIIFVGRGDRLCWGRENRQQDSLLINQLALFEFVYLFCLLAIRVYEEHLDAGDLFAVEIRTQHLVTNGENPRLEPGQLDRFSGGNERSAPGGAWLFKQDISLGDTTPERAAFLLLAKLYAWVGYEEERMPYSKLERADPVLDPEAIRQASKRPG